MNGGGPPATGLAGSCGTGVFDVDDNGEDEREGSEDEDSEWEVRDGLEAAVTARERAPIESGEGAAMLAAVAVLEAEMGEGGQEEDTTGGESVLGRRSKHIMTSRVGSLG